MADDFDRSPYTKKAFELSYAMLRISRSLEIGNAASCLDDFSHQLLRIFVSGDYGKALSIIEEIGWFARLWTDLGIIHRPLGESLLLELSKLKNLSSEAILKTVLPNHIQSIFPSFSRSPVTQTATHKVNQATDSQISEPDSRKSNFSIGKEPIRLDQINRQSAITGFFRERALSGNPADVCRMKDVQDRFPLVSERTLRYDLQSLVEEGVIERVGTGPMSAYRLATPQGFVTPSQADRYNS
jgi:hypothetical protein